MTRALVGCAGGVASQTVAEVLALGGAVIAVTGLSQLAIRFVQSRED